MLGYWMKPMRLSQLAMTLELRRRQLSIYVTDCQSKPSDDGLVDCIFDDDPLGFERGLEHMWL